MGRTRHFYISLLICPNYLVCLIYYIVFEQRFNSAIFEEVQRAASIIKQVAKGHLIRRVETSEDKIVYSGTTHNDFVMACCLSLQ